MSNNGSPLDPFFKFKIGDLVEPAGTFALAAEHQRKIDEQMDTPIADRRWIKPPAIGRLVLQIMGRLLEECPGGVQRKYTGRYHNLHTDGSLGSTALVSIYEEELLPFVWGGGARP
jgi:hypothetical protein